MPLFAVEDWHVGLAAAVFTGVGVLLGKAADLWRSRRKDAIDEYEAIIDRLQKRQDRLESQADEQQRVINRLAELHGECRQEGADLYAVMTVQNNTLRRWAPLLAKAGIAVAPEEVPEMPPRPGRGHESEAEFLKRTTAMNTAALVPPRTTGGADAGAAGRGQPDHPDQPH